MAVSVSNSAMPCWWGRILGEQTIYINVSIGCFGSKWSGRLQVDPWIVLPIRAFDNNCHLTDSWIVQVQSKCICSSAHMGKYMGKKYVHIGGAKI